ncbi:hypothetical protein ABPG75_013153 [Micractinium tetrahymenae]
MEGLLPLRPALQRSLRAAAAWFRGMVDPSTQRLHYSYSVSHGRHEDRRCPIRDIGTAADLAVLSAATGSREFDTVIASTLQHYESILVRQKEQLETWAHLSGGQDGLGEPSSVAHSAMLLLALAAWEGHPSEAARRRTMGQLAAGIMHQQRPDGSLRIFFEPGGPGLYGGDAGWQLYGGEAAFAIATTYGRLRDDGLLRAAAAALRAFQARYRRGEVDPDELVFFANWQCAAGGTLHCLSGDAGERAWVAAYLAELQDDILDSAFYDQVKQAPHQQAVVEVACALEGLSHSMAVSQAQLAAAAPGSGAGSEGAEAADEERQRLELYAACARVAVAFLLAAQVQPGPGVPAAAVGGFPHSLRAGSGQRVDVTGHVCCAFVKLLELLGREAAEE